jgi:hypothetical protein
MKMIEPPAELRAAISDHLSALADADTNRAERFVADRARDAHRKFAEQAARAFKPISVEALGLGKIGTQYVSKLRVESGAIRLTALFRWRAEDDGRWRIVEVEDLSGKRSPWSDVPDPASAARQAETERGNA